MRRAAPVLWLLVVCAALVYLGIRVSNGLELQSNVLALLPRAEQDSLVQRAQDRITAIFSRRVVLLVGHRDPARAHEAGHVIATSLKESGITVSVTAALDPETQRRLAAFYFPFRQGLLSDADRAQLRAGKGEALVNRALSLVYGPGGIVDARLLARDPFMLMPSFFTSLPLPQSRLTPEDGLLTVHDGDMTYAFVSAVLDGDAFSTAFQEKFDRFLDRQLTDLVRAAPDLVVLRAGAIFYAQESAKAASGEISTIGLVSLLGTVALIVIVFRALRPIVLSVLAIGVGIICAFAATLFLFGEMHAVALLFGVSLIGISVDYSLQYFCEYFDKGAPSAVQRLRRVLPGVAIGLFTTLIGYLTLLLAPFPGLRQMAVFSVFGLTASFLTVALWYPLLDRGGPVGHGARLVHAAGRHWSFWEAGRWRAARWGVVAACALLGVVGALVVHVDDDVRHLQSLSAALKAQEEQIQRLTGASGATQFLLVQNSEEQGLLETEETLIERLDQAQRDGLLAGFQAPAQFVPSISRQRESRALVREKLIQPYLAGYLAQIGFASPLEAGEEDYLSATSLPNEGPLALLTSLVIDGAGRPTHVILLNGVTDTELLRQRIEVPGLRLISPAEDVSRLFAAYRRYAMALLALSAVLMWPMLAWRYGWRGGLRVMAPSVAAVVLAPPIAALCGVSFTFFNAMALVLVLSIGVDYSVFCRETSGARKPVTMLAVCLAALSTILSFGLLALSQVFAVHAFGVTMLIGIALAFLLAPAAGDGEEAHQRALQQDGRRYVPPLPTWR
jgi:predicted exporter